MANGTVDEKVARADRIREQSAFEQKRAEQNRRGTQNALAALKESVKPGTEPYRVEMDSVDSTVTAPWVTAKLPLPRMARMAIGFGLGFLLVCCGVWLLLRAWKG